jgi:hypothetical protein
MVIGIYDIICGKNNLSPVIKASIYTRLLFFFGVLILFLLNQLPKEMLLLGVIDAAGAIWTILAIRSSTLQ